MKSRTPRIRPGQCSPYIKGTRRQISYRVRTARKLIRQGRTKFQIHRHFREVYGIQWRQTDRYMACAHAHVGVPNTATAQP